MRNIFFFSAFPLPMSGLEGVLLLCFPNLENKSACVASFAFGRGEM